MLPAAVAQVDRTACKEQHLLPSPSESVHLLIVSLLLIFFLEKRQYVLSVRVTVTALYPPCANRAPTNATFSLSPSYLMLFPADYDRHKGNHLSCS